MKVAERNKSDRSKRRRIDTTLDPEVIALVDAAVRYRGVDRNDVIEQLVRDHLPDYRPLLAAS